MLTLFEEKKQLTRDALKEKLRGIPESSLSRTLKALLNEKKIMEVEDAEGKKIYVLLTMELSISSSRIHRQLKELITSLQPLFLYPLEAVSESFSTLLGGDEVADVSAVKACMHAVNFVLQHQHSLETSKILNQYKEGERLQLQKVFAKVVMSGLIYCLQHNVPGLRSRIPRLITEHHERIPQIIKNDYSLLLEYGLAEAAPSFLQKKSHLRLLALELQKIIPKESFLTANAANQKEVSVKLSEQEKRLLTDFLESLCKTRFMLITSFGFPELEESQLINPVENFRSFHLWMQRLKDGTLDTEHASFLFTRGARNLERAIRALTHPSFKLIDTSKSAEERRILFKDLVLRSRVSQVEKELFFAIDLREPWDLLFLFDNHSRGDRPEFYSEILSLVRKRRDEAKKIPNKGNAVRKVVITRRGFLIYYEGQKQPKIIGPSYCQ